MNISMEFPTLIDCNENGVDFRRQAFSAIFELFKITQILSEIDVIHSHIFRLNF